MSVTVDAVISEELFISVSTYMVRYLARAESFRGTVRVVYDTSTFTFELGDPVLMFTPGGCIVTGGNCWYGFGLLDLRSFSRDKAFIIGVSFSAVTEVGEIGIAVDGASIEVLGGSLYRVEVYASVTPPDKGLVRIIHRTR